MKTSTQKILCPLILLFAVVAVAPAFAYPELHQNSNGWIFGTHGTKAYAYVSGWWWGTEYCNPPGYPFTFAHRIYPNGAYWEPGEWGQCGTNYAYSRTDVYWKDQYGEYHLDSEAFAAI
jgi:hypothetical protein